MSAKNFMEYSDAETVLTGFANAIKVNKDAVSAIKDGTDLDSFGDVEVALLDKADTSDLGTAAAKDSTNSVTAGSTDLVESGAVKEAIDAAVAAVYHHAGTKTVAQLTHDLLIAANEGNVYNITDSGTTTSDFIEGIGKQIDAGDNVGICKVGNVYMFDLLSGLEDTSIFVQKSQTSGLMKNDGTVNTTIEDTVAGHTTALAGKQDKYETITYAQWQALTPAQQAAKDYYISDYPSSTITAGNVSYDNTSSGMSANKVQGAIDELKGGLTDRTKALRMNVPVNKTDIRGFLGHILGTIIDEQNTGTYVVDGAWVNHDYYIGIVYKLSSTNAIGIIHYGTDNLALYSVSYMTGQYIRYKGVQFVS